MSTLQERLEQLRQAALVNQQQPSGPLAAVWNVLAELTAVVSEMSGTAAVAPGHVQPLLNDRARELTEGLRRDPLRALKESFEAAGNVATDAFRESNRIEPRERARRAIDLGIAALAQIRDAT